LRTWPRDQLLILRYEDYIQTTAEHLEAVLKFLGLAIPEGQRWREMVEAPVKNKGRRGYGDMRNDTRALLEGFYEPFNRRLAEQLKDRRFEFLPTLAG
jgi:N-acetylgalactosamine 4-sulfate 6-O-sulfotransferase